MKKYAFILLLISTFLLSPTVTMGDSTIVEIDSIGETDVRPLSILKCVEMTEEDIEEEDRLGDMEMISQLVEAEAGNQDLLGKQLVVDVVLNRVDSTDFPDTVEEVIFQEWAFEVIKNGAFDEAAWYISQDSFKAVELEYENRTNSDVLYFSQKKSEFANSHFKHQDHWFGW